MDNIKLDRPIFLIGCGKSGTTFLSLLLYMNPEVGSGFFYEDDKISHQKKIDSILNQNIFNQVAHEFEQKEIWDSYFPIDTKLRIGNELALFENFLSEVETLGLIKELTKYFNKNRFLGKQPFNTFRVHVLREIFPDCKLVTIHRDGRDVVASWGEKQGHSWDMFGGYKPAIEMFARKWNECIDHLEYYKDSLDILVVRYEDMMVDMEKEMRRICEHCEIKYDKELYSSLQSRATTGKWKEVIPFQYHKLVNDLTYRNRERLGYIETDFKIENSPIEYDNFEAFYSASTKEIHNCPICNGLSFETISFENRHKINLPTVICKNCSLVMVNPRPSNEWYSTFYKEWFWTVYIGGKKSAKDLYQDDQQEYKGKLIGDLIMSRASYIKTSSQNYLDIGAGLGGLVGYIKSQNNDWNVVAVEPSKEAAELIRSKNNNTIHVFENSLEEINLIAEKFDIISLIHVLEHCLNPTHFLSQVRGMLKDDGIFYIEVPDLYSDHWIGKDFFHIAHAFLFDKETLKLALNKAGLDCIEFVNSPVEDVWPWGVGVFAKKSATVIDNKELYSRASEVRHKKKWIKAKLDQNIQKVNYTSHLKNKLGAWFPRARVILKELKKTGKC